MNYDEIFVLDKGNVIEAGKFGELSFFASFSDEEG
jgi:ABC-type multidrug transport system fused ATPase/permease subunit